MSQEFQNGHQLAGYRVTGLLGRGGMGLVYEAEHLILGRKAALKTLAAELAEDAEFRERFVRESQVVAAIDHPNIIPIYDAGEVAGTAYIAMRYVQGCDLSDLLIRDGALDLERAIAILDQAGGALDAAHARDLVHRDIKPANVLVDEPTGRIYLTDFGIAKQGRSRGLTKAGFFLGTIDYAAPEQIEGKDLTAAADIYAFGCMLFECLTGHKPFERDTDVAVVHAHLLDDPPAASALRPELPPALDEVLARAMAKDETARFSSCRELIDAVRACAGGRAAAPVQTAGGLMPWEAAAAPAAETEATVSLPSPPTSLVGRTDEIARAAEHLRRDDARLLTLTGLSGVGKTRLAIAVAGELTSDFDRVCFVDLSTITDPAVVGASIAAALGVEEARGQALLAQLQARLAGQRVLLVLDNFEQVLAAAPFVGQLLEATDLTKILVTSQAALHVRGESEQSVQPLDPDAAVQLFVERAQAVKSDFELTEDNASDIAEICARLDGLPLALELAAARVRLLPPHSMLSRLERRLELLTGGDRTAPETQQTLKGAIDWSYQLLEPNERTMLARLGVFVGGASLEAAEAASLGELGLGEVMDALASLVDKSLLRQDESSDGEPRFKMLETIREYALDRLAERGEEERLRELHAERFVALAEAAEPELSRPGQAAWLQRLDEEQDNLRAALQWSIEHGRLELGLRLAGSLVRFWSTRGLMTEGRRWLEAALQQRADGAAPTVRAKALFAAGYAALGQGDFSQAERFFEESLDLARSEGDQRGEAACLAQLGWLVMARGAAERAEELSSRSLEVARLVGDKLTASGALNILADIASERDEYAQATQLFEESLGLRRELGDKRLIANSLLNLGRHQLTQDAYEHATELLEEGLALARELRDTWSMSVALNNLARVQLHEGEHTAARTLFAEALALARDRGDKRVEAECIQGLAGVLAAQGDGTTAAKLWGAAEQLLQATGATPSPAERAIERRFLAPLAVELGEPAIEGARGEGRALAPDDAVKFALSVGGTAAEGAAVG